MPQTWQGNLIIKRYQFLNLDVLEEKDDHRRHKLTVENRDQYDVENKPRHHYDTLPH